MGTRESSKEAGRKSTPRVSTADGTRATSFRTAAEPVYLAPEAAIYHPGLSRSPSVSETYSDDSDEFVLLPPRTPPDGSFLSMTLQPLGAATSSPRRPVTFLRERRFLGKMPLYVDNPRYASIDCCFILYLMIVSVYESDGNFQAVHLTCQEP